MRNKILLCGLIIVIMALILVFGYTNARYYSTASMTGDLDYVKTIGEISIYHPEWAGDSYEGPDNGSGVFSIPEVPINYPNIHYKVTNKINDEINEKEVSYYIRIVAEDGSNNIPIEYDVHEYNTPSNILPTVDGVNYGPFTLKAISEEEQLYSIKANWTSTDSAYATSIQHLKVQIVKERIDGTLKVIDEAPLNMKYSGPKVKATFAYYLYGTTQSLGTSQTLEIEDNITIDFNNSSQLTDLGITLPDGYIFHDVRGVLPGYDGTATKVVIPEGPCLAGYYLEVYLTSNTVVPVELHYYDYTKPTTSGTGNTYEEIGNYQTLIMNRGITIDFTSEVDRNNLGINLPSGYSLQGLNGDLITNNKYTATVVTIPSSNIDASHNIEVYMKPAGSATVNLSYYEGSISGNKIDTQTLTDVGVGTVIDFKNSVSLSNLGITLPSGYEFNTAYCSDLDNTGTGNNTYTIPYNGANKTYSIDVVLDKVITTITVPVKFYNSSGTEVRSTTVDMKSDGTFDFTTSICRTLCPELNTMTSFTIYIANQWNSTYELANVANGTVTVDYNATYTSWADFKLTDEGSYIYIKAWW